MSVQLQQIADDTIPSNIGMPSAARICFGAFELDVETGELWKHGHRLRLPPKPARLLALLAGSPGQLVTREAIRAELWEGDITVNFDQGLNFSIRKIRSALGDSAENPKFIETLPRRGYRFIGEIDRPPARSEAERIQACELYGRARQKFNKADKNGLEEAMREFAAALALDPQYALAHSGLGATHALRYLNRRDPADLETARTHLERALELDAEIAEPYPWLCYLFMRIGQVDQALEFGHRGVELRPDLVQAHYFLGLAYFCRSETDPANYSNAAAHLLEAGRVAPEWQATWFVLSFLALLNGEYEHAAAFARRLLDGGTRSGLPFIGAEIVLASVEMRSGRSESARKILSAFVERMNASDHMYRDSMIAIAGCLLGDVEIRDARPAEALVAYRKAWNDLQEHSRVAAHLRIACRAQAGLASAYAALGERERALGLLAAALRLAEESHLPMHSAAGASLAELFLSVAAACVRARQLDRAAEMLRRAVASGWSDAAWLELDPELAPMRGEAWFTGLIEEVRRRPKVYFAALRASAES
jgi:DNA-binding winged helix-turn-helix (wHTH) protein